MQCPVGLGLALGCLFKVAHLSLTLPPSWGLLGDLSRLRVACLLTSEDRDPFLSFF
jgi:hypothetical protein